MISQLKIDDTKLADSAFLSGQRIDAGSNLSDKGMINIAGDSHETVDKKLQLVKHIFDVGGAHASLKKLTIVTRGDVRLGDQSAHEQ